MPPTQNELKFDTGFAPVRGSAEEIAPGLRRIVAPNSGPFTFTGTNTYLVGDKKLFVVDPGPDDNGHLETIVEAVSGNMVTAIVLTHTHRDHCALTRKLSKRLDAPIWSGGAHRLSRPLRRFEINRLAAAGDWKLEPDRRLEDGEVIETDGPALEVINTPGHCANHLSFGVKDTPYLLSGDHVMGWNTTLVSVPDGSMADYFSSLQRLLDRPWDIYLPGHGGPIEQARAHTRALKTHRQIRGGQVEAAVAGGCKTVGEIVRKLYPGVSLMIRHAAAMTVEAHVEYLEEAGRVRVHRNLGRARITPIR